MTLIIFYPVLLLLLSYCSALKETKRSSRNPSTIILPTTSPSSSFTSRLSPPRDTIPVAGCGMFGCEPGLSFVTTLTLPGSPNNRNDQMKTNPLPKNFSRTHTSSNPPPSDFLPHPTNNFHRSLSNVSVRWIIHPDQENACKTISDPVSSGGGCLSQSISTVCTYPLQCTSTGYSSGILSINSTNGDILYNYTGTGSGRCRSADTSYGYPLTLPIMDAYGDVVTWDNTYVTLLVSGTVAWTKILEPDALCTDALLSPTVSNTSRLIFGIASTGELFGYYADGVPIASVILYSNITDDKENDSIIHYAETSGNRKDTNNKVKESFGNSIIVPISTMPVSNGIRFVYVGRLYKLLNPPLETTVDNNNNSSNEKVFLSSNQPFRDSNTTMVPTNQLSMATMDLHDEGLPRMGLPWQFSLPVETYPELMYCVPSNRTNGNTVREILYVAGPVLLSTGNTIIFAVSCNYTGIINQSLSSVSTSSLPSSSFSNSMIIFSIGIDTPHVTVPSLLWSKRIPLVSAVSTINTNYSLIYSRSMFLDAISAFNMSVSSSGPSDTGPSDSNSASSNSFSGNYYPQRDQSSSNGTNIVWIVPENSDSLYGIESDQGNLHQLVNLTEIYSQQRENLLPSSRMTEYNCLPFPGSQNTTGFAVLLYGYPLASLVTDSIYGDNGTMVVLNARIVIMMYENSPPKDNSENTKDNDTIGALTMVATMIQEQYVLLGLYISSSVSSTPQLQWCVPTPANHPVHGQITSSLSSIVPNASILVGSSGREIFSIY